MFRDNKSKKNTEYTLAKQILIFLFITLLFSIAVDAYERPQFKDGLTDAWHPGSYCIPCHYTLIGPEKAQNISNGCKCHDYTPKGSEGTLKVDMKQIFDIHKDIVCIRCHVGMKEENNVTAADFHRVMSKTACLSCHTYANGTIQKPIKTSCSDCHGGDPHVVHGDKLDKMCVACHGEFADKYVNPPSALRPSLSQQPAVAAVKEYPTIAQFIGRLIGSLMQMVR